MKLAASLAAAVFTAGVSPILALTVPVAEDASTSIVDAATVITPASGVSPTLAVNARHTALLRFDLTDLDVIPAAISPGSIKSAILRFYVVSAKPTADVTIHSVTTAWSDRIAGNPLPAPAINATALATISAAELGKMKFVSVDITAAVSAALQGGNIFGFAIETSDPDAKIVLASKEGPGFGEPAELDIDADLGSGGSAGASLTLSGNLTLPTTTASTGIIYAGTTRLLHDFGTSNFFGGLGAGNFTMTGSNNAAIGYQSLSSNTSGGYNAALGVQALFSNAGGIFNTAIGYTALYANTSGFSNTATGAGALAANTIGYQNTAGSDDALNANISGNNNTASGYASLFLNQTGSNNTATGAAALYSNTGDNNTATGYSALYSNTTATHNTADGYQSLFFNTGGNDNTASGFEALYANTSGANNSAFGSQALIANTTGSDNTAIGSQALLANRTGSYNTSLGIGAARHSTTGVFNIVIGYYAGDNVTGSNNICIGSAGNGDAIFGNDTINIGGHNQTNAFIGGIYGSASGQPGTPVYVDLNGKLFTAASSQRFKDSIQSMDEASDVLLQMRPVTFRYKPEFGRHEVPQFGLIAEEVAALNPDLVTHDATGDIFTVRYEQVNAMLLNEFLKEHKRVGEQEARLTAQEQLLTDQQKQIRELTEGMAAIRGQLSGVLASPATPAQIPTASINTK